MQICIIWQLEITVYNIFTRRCIYGTKEIVYPLQLNVEGFPYAGMGNSTNKKDAQSNAARDFCQYLVRQGQMKAEDVPAMGKTQVSFG